MKKHISAISIFFLVFGFVLMMGCSKDDGPEIDTKTETENKPDVDENGGGDPTEQGGQIVSGDPSLNDFIVASKGEVIYTLDAQTGEETEIFTLPDFTYPKILADYKDDTVFLVTDDNSVNAIDPFGKGLIWEVPMLEFSSNSIGFAAPSCIDGTCYASGGTGVVVAVDQVTGDLKWYYSSDSDGELDNVINDNEWLIIKGDKVYVFSDSNNVYDLPPYMHVLDRQTGALLNKIELPFPTTGTPVIEGDRLYLPAGDFYVINLDTFDIIWQFEANGVGTPAISNGKVVISATPPDADRSSALYCFDVDSNKVLWKVDTGVNTIWAPLIVENVVFSNYDKGTTFYDSTWAKPFAVDLESGKQLWFKENATVKLSPVYANGRLFFIGIDNDRKGGISEKTGMMSLDANTGEILWLNPFMYDLRMLNPLVVAKNGVFGPSYYRGN